MNDKSIVLKKNEFLIEAMYNRLYYFQTKSLHVAYENEKKILIRYTINLLLNTKYRNLSLRDQKFLKQNFMKFPMKNKLRYVMYKHFNYFFK